MITIKENSAMKLRVEGYRRGLRNAGAAAAKEKGKERMSFYFK